MSNARKLSSDELGQKGEARFRELCNNAKLICNKADYDRTGWDFIVEFPLEGPGPGSSLDKRATPLSCHVQVKTMWSGNDSFQVRLSAIERLAKEPKPSFVYVLKIGDDLEPVAAYLIPMLDEALATVLRQLRAATAEGRTRINQSRIRFPLPAEHMIAPSGEALRSTLIRVCGPDCDVAIRRKAEQLKSLGFEANAFQAETTFVLENENEIADVLLGLKPVQIEQFRGFETRFGIKLPVPDMNGSGLMHIQPNPIDRCQIVVRGAGFAVPASVPAEIIVPSMRLDKFKTKYLVRAELFDIEVTQAGMQLNTKPESIKSAKLSLGDWINFFRMMTIFSAGAATVEIVPASLPRARITTKIGAFPDHEQSARILSAFESVEVLIRLAGAEAPLVLLGDVLPAAERYVAVAGLFSGLNCMQPLRFRASWPKGALPEEMDALYIDAIQVAGIKLAFSCIATMVHEAGDGDDMAMLQWSSRAVKGHEVISVRSYLEDYDKFAERSKSETGIDAVMMATYDEEGPTPG
ncbi:hypothetical protein JJC00_32645 [Bradyrhizobium diazoefficiens]|uniref:hypothetical protein n=1 Tax=Bradyrhizobium diazoefficiens TaxID=1355477 RepID=UPI00190B30E5|nr:hypothetical protein [Bradyrhizobium diazoefficiens]QQO33228.1 hypothetical protein JJC00_32645 [Bradyrhizobium diazoefficiens]